MTDHCRGLFMVANSEIGATSQLPADASSTLRALLDRIDALEAALRPFAEKQTTDELLNDPKPSEWPGTTLKRRVEILGEGVRKHNAEILAARAALQETPR